ncbi:MAG: aldehyde ferredoxin oxidoreductase N-terminal domain-containing protein, partial [Bacteroidota bacterium]
MNFEEFASKHKLLKSWKYTWAPIDKGYNDRTLYVNVGNSDIREKPVSPEMKEKFTGGKGYGLRLLWDATKPDTRWNDPENEIVINTGPICGITQYSGTGKSIVVTISPQTDIVIDSN